MLSVRKGATFILRKNGHYFGHIVNTARGFRREYSHMTITLFFLSETYRTT